MAEAAGLGLVREFVQDFTIYYDNARQALRSFKQTGATFQHHSAYRPHGAGEIRRLLRSYEQRHGRPDGRIPLTLATQFILAEKKP